MNLTVWCDRVIRWGFYLLFGLVPILLTPWNYELFEFNKMMAVYAITVVIGGVWTIKSITRGKLEIARTPLDVPLLLFVSSQLLSAIFSIDPHVSWFGYYSRFNGGMLSVISYILLYYAFVSNMGEVFREKYKVFRKNITEKLPADSLPLYSLTNILKVALATGVVVALYAVAERLGIDKHLWVQDVQNRVFSTLGQPNWLAAYLVALMPIAMAFGLQCQMPNAKCQIEENVKRISFIIYHLAFCILFFTVLLFTRSRSGLVGFAVSEVVFWGLILLKSSMPGFKGAQSLALGKGAGFTSLLLHLAFTLIVFFNGTNIDSIDQWITLEGWKSRLYSTIQPSNHPTIANDATPSATYTAPLLETGGTESGTIRKYVWQGAINAWKSSTKAYLIGTGTETFAFAFYQYRPREHNLTSEWDFLYNKAHNEYLNYLATTGIFGLGSYLLIIGVFIIWFFKSQYPISNIQQGSKSLNWSLGFGHWILRIALFAGWLSILVTNFFGFSVVIVQVFLFVFPAIMVVSNHEVRMINYEFKNRSMLPGLLVLLVSLVLLTMLSLGWYADTLYASGYRASRAGQYDIAAEKLSRASRFNPGEPLFADELGSAYAGFATVAIDEKNATKAAQLVRSSLSASDRAITTSPKNVNFWKTRTKIYYTFASFDPEFNAASIEALEHAQKLSPNDPKITYNLSILYGRKGDNTKAIELLKSSIDLKPNYRDAYYALWVFYTEVRKPDLARQTVDDYLRKVDPGDKEFLSIVNK